MVFTTCIQVCYYKFVIKITQSIEWWLVKTESRENNNNKSNINSYYMIKMENRNEKL